MRFPSPRRGPADDDPRAHQFPAGRLAWSLSIGYWLIAAAAIVLTVKNGNAVEPWIGGLLAIGGYAVIGGLIAARRPRNPIGWLMLLGPLAAGTAVVADQLSIYGLVTMPGSIPLAEFAGWVSLWLFTLLLPTLIFAAFLFPTGRLPSPRWRPVVWVISSFFLGVTLTYAFGTPRSALHPEIVNPYLIPALRPVYEAMNAAFWLYLIAFGLGAASLVARYRGASRTEQQQLKWIVMAGVLMVVFFLAGYIVPGLFGWVPGLLTLPVAIGIAILRQRLFDIDLLINRVVVYLAVTATLGVSFFVGLVLLQAALRPVTGASELGVAISTLASFALFQPVRRRIQSAVDRRFDRRKYDAERTLDAFSARLRDEIDLEALRGDLMAAVGTTMAPAHVSLWLRDRPR